jgi:hypothetical protein
MEVTAMFKIKLVLLSVLALLPAGLAFTASASAGLHHYLICVESEKKGGGQYENRECKKEGGSKNWEKEKLENGSSYTFFGEGASDKLEAAKFTIECVVDTSVGNIEGAGKSFTELEFSSCKVKNKPSCTVSNYLLRFKGLLLDRTGEGEVETKTFPVELTLEPGSEVTISGCSVEGKYKFKGKETCKMPHLGEMKEKHELICEPSTGEIEIERGGEELVEKGVKFFVKELLHLVGKPFWAAE